LDASGQRGSFSADVPLDSFNPPLRKADLAGLVVKIGMPPNGAQAQPTTFVDKNGKGYLRVGVQDAEVNALRQSPITLAVGDAASMQGNTMAPKFVAQVSARDVSVDATQPQLALERRGRATDAQFLSSLQADRASMADGSSNWFSGRQLEMERNALLDKAKTTESVLAPVRAKTEAAMAAGGPLQAAFAMPEELQSQRDPLVRSLSDFSNRSAALAEAEKNRQMAKDSGVLTDSTGFDAKVAEAKAALGEDPTPQVKQLYAKVRSDDPVLADRWLASYARMEQLPQANQITNLVSDAGGIRMGLQANQANLTRFQNQDAAAAPGRIADLDRQIAAAKAKLAAEDARISGLKDGTIRSVEPYTTTYAPDAKFI
jgi:hypothetical protein